MSYILEAIKKLEQKRQEEGAPNILTLQGGIAQVRKKRLLWPYAVTGIILLNGVTALSLLWTTPWRHADRPPAVETPPARESTSPLPASVPAENKEQQQTTAKKEVPSAPQKKVSQPDVSPPAATLTRKANPKSSPVEPALALSSVSDKTRSGMSPGVKKPASPRSRAMDMHDLPANLKSSLPELKMTVHSYHESSQSRFAIINNQNMKEGQFLIPELKLEKITPDGAIFNYQGHHFRLGIN